jgi:hypothetical protein
MQIFISWSGERSKDLAVIVTRWLAIVVPKSLPWMSEVHLEVGRHWGAELGHRLRESGFGVACVTPENIAAPWLLFEAGALATSVECDRFVPLLFGASRNDLPAPLAQFQALEVGADHMLRLALAVSDACCAEAPERDRVPRACELTWPWFEAEVNRIPAPTAVAPAEPPPPVAETAGDREVPAPPSTGEELAVAAGTSSGFLDVMLRELESTEEALKGYDSLARFYSERSAGVLATHEFEQQHSALRYKRAALLDALRTLKGLGEQ